MSISTRAISPLHFSLAVVFFLLLHPSSGIAKSSRNESNVLCGKSLLHAIPAEYRRNKLIAMAEAENVEQFKALLHSEVSINKKSKIKALFMLASANKPYYIHLMLVSNVDPNIQNKHGATALMPAADCGNIAVMQVLIQNGANVNLRSKNGTSPLLSSIVSKKMEAAIFLLASGAIPLKGTNRTSGIRAAESMHLSKLLPILKIWGSDNRKARTVPEPKKTH